MIELLLREQLAPVAQRRRQLTLRHTLTIVWLTAAALAAILLLLNRLWGWDPFVAAVALAGATLIASLAVYRLVRRQHPDYAAIARHIEKHHPDLKALLLTAVEQRPETPQGGFNYLQERLLEQAVRHARHHRWIQTVPAGKLTRANWGRFAAAVLLLVVFSQLHRPTSVVLSPQGWLDRPAEYRLEVSPGNAQVEAGSPVVITARFTGKVPSQATLWMGPNPDELEAASLARNLDDPVFGTMVPSITQETVYAIEYDGRRSDMYRLSVFENPELLSVDATIRYPDYAHLPDKTIKDTRRVSVPEGSLVSLDFHLNKPAATARLLGREGGVLDLAFSPEAPTTGRIRIEARQSERYELKLVDADGRGNALPPRFSLQVNANQPAQIKTTFPGRDVRPSPLEELTLEAEVRDDYAVTQYGLSYAVAGRDSQTIILGSADQAPAPKNAASFILDLESLHVQPDQLLTYYFWATDMGPDQTPRRAAGDMFFVEIRPFEEAFQESQSFQDSQDQQQDRDRDPQPNQGENASGQRNTEQLIQRQKEIISATWNLQRQAGQSGQSDPSESFADDAGTIHQSQAELRDDAQTALGRADDPETAEALGRAVGHIESALAQLAAAQAAGDAAELTPALRDEQAAYQEFLKLRGREFQVARAQSNRQGQQSANSSGQRSSQQLQQMELQQRENRYETERRASLDNQNQNQTNQRENLQVLNRLRELARRQNDVSEKLKELQAELRQADPARQEEIRRRLQRLREQQQQLLGDMDDLQERLDRPENRQRLADADRQLDQTRQDMQQATEQMAEGRLSSAVSSTSRAGRQLEEVRDEIRQQTANQFADQMRQMRRQAQQLDREEQEIAERIRQAIEDPPRSLSDAAPQAQLAERIDQQRQVLEDLAEQMRTVSEQATESEPLLSNRLYDSLRQNRTEDIDRSLEVTGELLVRNFLPEAREVETFAGRQIEQLRRGVEQAAEGVLGSQAETLRQARRQLEDLIQQARPQQTGAPAAAAAGGDPNRLQLIAQNLPNRNDRPPRMTEEMGQATRRPAPSSDRQESDRQESGQQESGRQGSGRQGSGRQETNSSNRQPPDGQNPPGANGRPGSGNTEPPSGGNPADPDSPSPGQTGENPSGRPRSLRAAGPGPAGGNRPFDRVADSTNRIGGGAITGDDYRQWSDRLREVEEMLDDPEWQGEVARVRQSARQMRTDLQRHGRQPQWDLLRDQVIDPLVDLHRRLGEELALLESDDRLVPIDRDPVPQRYSELVRSYYERLAGGGE